MLLKIFIPFLIVANFFACKKKKTTPNEIPPTPVVTVNFAKGADISWLTEMEANNIKFYDANGTPQECMALLKSIGMNTIRIRAWVNPTNNYNNTADVVAKAIRAKNLGMRIMINFHYSDTWADPGSQTKPAAWAALDFATLKATLYNYTQATLTSLKNNNVTPEWVQVGNETNDGMLWPTGKASTNMSNFAQLINSGYDAVKNVFPNAKVIVHVSNGNDNTIFRWLFDGLTTNGAKYDVIGMSLYPNQNDWAILNTQCVSNMNDMIARYNKEVMLVEVGMGYIYENECKAFIADLTTKTKAIPNEKGLGVLYWEPQCYNNWQGYSKGAFTTLGKPSAALLAFAN